VVEFKRWKAKRVRRNSRLVRPLMDSKPLLLAEAIAGRMPNYLDEFTKVFDMYGFVIDTITDEITLICRAIEQQAYAQGTIIYVEDEYRSGRLWNPLLKFEIGEQRRRYGGREKQGGFLLEFANTGTVKRLLYLIELRSCFIRCRNRLMQMLEHLGLWEIPRPRKAEAKLGRSRDIGNVDGSGLERWVPRRVRLGGVVRPLLELPRQTWLAGVMERRLPDYKERLRDMLRSLRAVINIIRDEIDLICENVRYQASLQGVSVRAVSRCDKGRRCGTCLGIYPWHYPYFMVSYGRYKDKVVKSKELRDFLRRFINENSIAQMEYMTLMRNNLLNIHNYTMLMFENMGVWKIVQPEEEVDG